MVDPKTLVISISQSGETVDTLMAQRYASERGAQTISICNTRGAVTHEVLVLCVKQMACCILVLVLKFQLLQLRRSCHKLLPHIC
ncbi:MAG: SIS domain-containing protein [Candidatus Ancillula trichonymphae]|nr:SIS domain-containing protein [Candidatus Ancillula trichonymphae]